MKNLGRTLTSAAILWMSIWGLYRVQDAPKATKLQSGGLEQTTSQPAGLAQVRLHASDFQAHDYFGNSVAMDGDVLAVGAPGVDQAGHDSGAIYVFQHDGQGWDETAKLAPDDLGAEDQLGTAVALDGGTLAAGAAYATSKEAGFAAGAVYIFVRQGDGWRQQARLTARDGAAFDLFGAALALEGNTLVVGARAADGPSGVRNEGAAYVYQRQGENWVETGRLSAADGAENDFFGQAVALQGDQIAAGAFGHDDPTAGPNAGAVYLFQRRNGAWFAGAELKSAHARAQAQFGYAVQFAKGKAPTWLVVGANQYSIQAVDPRYSVAPGRLELFQWKDQGWQAAIQLEGDVDEKSGSGYSGSSVAIQPRGEDQLLLASAGLMSRNARLYQIINQAPGSPLTIEPPNIPINFGCSLALSANWLAVGSRWDFEPVQEGQIPAQASSSGAVYLYDLNGLK
jgi:FG-GAP repeat